MEKEICEGLSNYEIEAWIARLQSVPKKVFAYEDRGEPYVMRKATVLLLENKKYALITESGCSCYESINADIDLFPTKAAAMEALKKWVKQQDGYTCQ